MSERKRVMKSAEAINTILKDYGIKDKIKLAKTREEKAAIRKSMWEERFKQMGTMENKSGTPLEIVYKSSQCRPKKLPWYCEGRQSGTLQREYASGPRKEQGLTRQIYVWE